MKLESQNEVKSFSGTILSCDYKIIEAQSQADMPTYYSRLEIESFTDCDNNDIDKTTYISELKMQEIKTGRKPRQHKFKITLYVDEDTYEQEGLHEGDILRLTNVKMNTDKDFRMRTYDVEKLKDYPNTKLHKDEQGKTYGSILITNMRLSCGVEDWSIRFKYDELYYYTIGTAVSVKFYQSCIQDIEQHDYWESYISKGEYNKLKQFNGQVVDMKCYEKKSRFVTYQVKIEMQHEKEINKYYLKATREEDLL